MTQTQWQFAIAEPTEVAQARRKAVHLAEQVGLDEARASKVGIVCTELGTNLWKHGGGGEILISVVHLGGATGVELLAIDKGSGMADLSACMSDGFSTSGSAGTGLGAIRRQSSVFDAYTWRKHGTVVLSQMFPANAVKKAHGEMVIGAVCLPKHGELSCGDAWTTRDHASTSLYVIADGLGHGEGAAEASAAAVRAFDGSNQETSLTDYLEVMHGALRSTRGAAVAVAELDRATRKARFSGVGNISGTIAEHGVFRHMVSHNGVLGHEIRKMQEFTYDWPVGATLIMHSDGLATWHMEKYPGLLARHPSVIAAVLYRDYRRERDDVTVLIAREAQS